MRQSIKDFFSWVSINGPFVLTFVAITGAMILAVGKDADINMLLPTLLGLYLGTKGGTSISAHWAAMKDPDADTSQIIREVEGLSQKPTGEPEGP